jgi:hypothetical protein
MAECPAWWLAQHLRPDQLSGDGGGWRGCQRRGQTFVLSIVQRPVRTMVSTLAGGHGCPHITEWARLAQAGNALQPATDWCSTRYLEMRAVAGSGTPNRRNRSMPRPPLSAPPTPHHSTPALSPHSAATSSTSACLLALLFGIFWRHSQSFQHRTLIPVHACSLDSGAPRYDSLTVSDSPPSSEPFVRSSVTPRTRRRLANTQPQ